MLLYLSRRGACDALRVVIRPGESGTKLAATVQVQLVNIQIPDYEPLASFLPGLTAIGFGAVAAARLVSKLDLLRIQPS